MHNISSNQRVLSDSVSRDRGFTLIEVLLALLITGMILAVALRFFYGQWSTTQVLKDKMEAHYAVVVAGRLLSDAIREAEAVEWAQRGKWTLTVTPSGESYTDQYYIDDKDYDGVKDLYRQHLGVPNPVVSGIVDWNCTQGDAGLWTITLYGKVGEQTVLWQSKSRARDRSN